MPDFRVGAAHDLPVRDGTFDRGAAHLHMLDAAGIGGDKPDFVRARRGFLIYDALAPELRGSYHLPFADIRHGTLTAISNGLGDARFRLPQMFNVGPRLETQARAVLDRYHERLQSAKHIEPAMQHAYSLLQIKSINDDLRIIEGIASTPVLDRQSDRMNPMGAKYILPLPYLWQHNPKEPIGNVEYAQPTQKGILFRARIPFISEPGPSKTRVDGAWQDLKHGLVRGASVGWNARYNGAKRNKDGGLDVDEWDWLELSAVTIPANQEANILSVKSICSEEAASGRTNSFQIILPPGVSGSLKLPVQRDIKMFNYSEQIQKLEEMRTPKAVRMDEVTQKAFGSGRTLDEAESKECSDLKNEIQALDTNLDLLRFQEKGMASTAQPVNPGLPSFRNAPVNSPNRYYPQAKEAKLEPGIRLARYVRCKALARLEQADAARIAEREYGNRDPWMVDFIKAGEVPAMMTTANGDGFVPTELGFGDFAEYLRPMTILGKFGAGNVPQMRRVPFRSGLVSMATGSSGYWVGEAKPKPLSIVDANRTHLLPLKVAAIIVATMELIRDSSPSAEVAIRNDMVEAIIATLDTTFIAPGVTASAGVSPASITNDQDSIVSTGDTADDIITDIRSLYAKFEAANNPASQAVLVMSTANARALGFMLTSLGGPQFPTMGANGGSLLGIPVVVSDHASTTVALISANDVLFADEGGVSVDMSTEASVEMHDSTHLTQHADGTSAGSSMVSLWQGNLVGFRAERTMNWVKRRPVVAPYLTSVNWGGAVAAS